MQKSVLREADICLPGVCDDRSLWGSCCLTIYPDGSRRYVAYDLPVFRQRGYEDAADAVGGDGCLHKPTVYDQDAESLACCDDVADSAQSADNVARAVRRARGAMIDWARCMDARYFFTGTLDASKVDRYDVAASVRRLKSWLDNRVRRQGLQYLLVPELHKDGALHWHGLLNGALPVVDSGTVAPASGGRPRKPRSAAQRASWLADGGHVVYNLPDWADGYSTAMELYGPREAALSYTCKYIGKAQGGQLPTKLGGRWWYHGGKVPRPERHVLELVGPDDLARVPGCRLFAAVGLGCRGASVLVPPTAPVGLANLQNQDWCVNGGGC